MDVYILCMRMIYILMWLSIPRACYHWEVFAQRVSILARGAGCGYSPGHSRPLCYYVIYISFGVRRGGCVSSHWSVRSYDRFPRCRVREFITRWVSFSPTRWSPVVTWAELWEDDSIDAVLSAIYIAGYYMCMAIVHHIWYVHFVIGMDDDMYIYMVRIKYLYIYIYILDERIWYFYGVHLGRLWCTSLFGGWCIAFKEYFGYIIPRILLEILSCVHIVV